MKKIYTIDLLDNLDLGDYGDDLNDYRDTDHYICDAISYVADNATSIHYSDILDFIRRDPEALADVIDEGLYDPSKNYDIWKHAQAAEYMTIERDIHENIADILMMCAVHFIRYDLNLEEIDEELAEIVREWCDEADHNDRMNEIPDQIREWLDERENEGFEEFCGSCDSCDNCKYRDCKSLDECKAKFKEDKTNE